MLEQARNKMIYKDKQLFAAEAALTDNIKSLCALCASAVKKTQLNLLYFIQGQSASTKHLETPQNILI